MDIYSYHEGEMILKRAASASLKHPSFWLSFDGELKRGEASLDYPATGR